MEVSGSSIFVSWSKNRRAPPFLRRNLQVVLDSLAMGSEASTEQSRTRVTLPAGRIHLTDPAQPYLADRPSKRRRIAKGSSQDQISVPVDYVETSLSSHLTQSVVLSQPGRQGPISTHQTRRRFPHDMVLDDPPDFQKALKIDIGTIIDKRGFINQSPPVESTRPIRVQTKCMLAIFASIPKEGSDDLNGQLEHKELIRLSQEGSIERTINESGQASIQVKLPEPFIIPGHSLYVNKLVRAHNCGSQDEPSDNSPTEYLKPDLSAYYIVKIWFSTLGTQRSWPPLDIDPRIGPRNRIIQILESGSLLRQEITLNCRTQLLGDKAENPRNLSIELKLGAAHEPTCYALQANISWSLPIRLNIPPREPPLPVPQNEHITVTYGRAPSEVENLAEIKVQGFCCALCERKFKSGDALKLHLKTIHRELIFSVRQPFSKPADLSVSFEEDESMQLSTQHSSASETLQLGPARKNFNTQSYLEGDQSWVKSRLGPDDTSGLIHHDSASSSSMHESQRSSPVTSPERMDIEQPEMLKAAPKPKSRAITVPQTRQRLFDTVSKRLLQPGEELSNSDDEVDESWVLSKHTDIINDFTDVTESEKDYIIHWDVFMLSEKITANKYVEDAMLRFVRQNRQWLSERPSRPLELAKHATILVLREALTVEGFKECSRLLREFQSAGAGIESRAERASRGKCKGKEQELFQPNPILYRGVTDCVCGTAVSPANAIICCTPECRNRYYHRSCIPATEVQAKDWRCVECR